ncbi:MAG: flagellar motor protein MotB [Lautropia sp.]
MAGPVDKKIQPIVVKRVKKVVHGHHGGAWKIAYADFVTAMMAFFLLMWLLGSTSSGDLQGISDYFKSPLKVALSGGRSSGDSSSLIQGGGEDLSRRAGQVKRGENEPDRNTVNIARMREERSREEARQQEAAKLSRLKQKVEEVIFKSPVLRELRDQIRLELTTDGLSIQIIDAKNRPMFASGSSVVQPYMRDLLRTLGGLLNEVDNPVSLTGHTDATPYAGGNRGYSNWELSAERANASRRDLIAGSMNPDKVLRVTGLGAVVPLDNVDPADPMNRRIAIVVLNQDARRRILRGAEVDATDTDAARRALQPAGGEAAGRESTGRDASGRDSTSQEGAGREGVGRAGAGGEATGTEATGARTRTGPPPAAPATGAATTAPAARIPAPMRTTLEGLSPTRPIIDALAPAAGGAPR